MECARESVEEMREIRHLCRYCAGIAAWNDEDMYCSCKKLAKERDIYSCLKFLAYEHPQFYACLATAA